ncbi:MAG TPA: sigma-54 dependent transcriptional regulator [Nannocystaceae bacterium]|nr:sigma-54 dependent transcriptional regulator [Nannocystaceae bacterium]
MPLRVDISNANGREITPVKAERSMTAATRLELDAWRIVSRNLAIGDAVQRLAELMRETIAIEDFALRRIVDGRADLICGWSMHGRPPAAPHLVLDAARLGAALADGPLRWQAHEHDALRDALDLGGSGAAFVAVSLAGAPLLVACFGGALDPTDAQRLLLLREPLQAAIANDARVHELERLREKFEADNRALLSRLQLQDISESVVGAETGLRGVMERVDQVARTEAPVLILGETGSGKEVVARAIHAQSRRAGGPFLRVNCGAIPAELVDSELFGHERGSFTGAINTRRGWFERADGGTLLLDEVAELPLAAQVRLLRVLQDGGFERVGGQQLLTADVRIVAATHRDVRTMIANGEFREDLWYRISVFPIQLPPLRERVGDIAPLARHFAARASSRLHGVALTPSDADLELLRTYEWPGNVRELSAVIERAAILGNGLRLDIATALGALPPTQRTSRDRDSFESVARRTIEAALRRAGGRIEGDRGAAHALGIHPATLRSRMRKLGIDWQRFRES